MFVLVFGLLGKTGKFFLDRVTALHRFEELFAVEIVPIRGDDDSGGVVRFQHFDRLGNLLLACILRVREDDAPRVLDLIVEKFSEVFHIHLAFVRVHHGGKTVEHRAVRRRVLHGANDIRKFPNARRLDENTIGSIFFENFAERLAEVTHERTANAPAVHFVDDDSRVLQESAVDADLPEFIFDQNEFFARVSLFQQFFNQRGFPRSQKARKNVDFSH